MKWLLTFIRQLINLVDMFKIVIGDEYNTYNI